jgi:hypothetical protein
MIHGFIASTRRVAHDGGLFRTTAVCCVTPGTARAVEYIQWMRVAVNQHAAKWV